MTKLKPNNFYQPEYPVPKLYGIIKDINDLDKFDFNTLPHSFALKPNTGYGGEGIIRLQTRKMVIILLPEGIN